MQTSLKAAQMAAQGANQLRFAMARLLYRLRHSVHVYPLEQDAAMPEHRVAWMDEMNGGPAKTILDAISTRPELWVHALPPEVCIVSRKTLHKSGLDQDAIEALAYEGMGMVEWHAAQRRATEEQTLLPTPATLLSK